MLSRSLILLEFPDGYDVEEASARLKNAGWILMIEDKEKQRLDLNKGYTSEGFAEKVYHLHVRAIGDWDEFYFRDYLRKYPEVARQYEELKLTLKEKFEHNRDAYTDANRILCRNIVKRHDRNSARAICLNNFRISCYDKEENC